MTSMPFLIDWLSFGAAAAAYAAALGVVLASRPHTAQERWLVAALAASVLWAVALAALGGRAGLPRFTPLLDAAHVGAWILFVAALMRSSSELASGRRVGNLLAAGVVVALAAIALAGLGSAGADAAPGRAALFGTLVLALIGLLGLEQVYRNSMLAGRRVLGTLAVGVGLIFAIDIFVYSQALLFADINLTVWTLRGLVNAAAVPLIILALKRQPDWSERLFVSRHVVFYTASLTATGLYLLAMSAGGYLIGTTGAEWSPYVQLLFFVLAGVVLVYALFSTTVRSRLKVFIAKHFYRNRYDYREEWLRLIDTLAGGSETTSLPERSVRALAAIIGSTRGELWIADASGESYEAHGTWRSAHTRRALAGDDALVAFLRETRWVVDTREYAEDPDKYSNAFADDTSWVEEPAIYVPLMHSGTLFGIVRLERPDELGPLGFEDHDLLKTAGQQVATFLAQERAQEQLSETRQFEAFSRLTAFLMHDLKNLIAQQELVVANAKRFKHKPEFVDDAIGTIEDGVRRMRGVLERLKSAGSPEKAARVDVGKVLLEVCSACADRAPEPVLEDADGAVRVAVDREKLSMAVTHAVRNAQDATPATGTVHVRLRPEHGRCVVEIEDTGAGMEAEFVRDHLFKPFDSTKGAKGMGIGAYQMRETLRSAGGDVEISSALGEGTCVRMSLPIVDEAGAASALRPLDGVPAGHD